MSYAQSASQATSALHDPVSLGVPHPDGFVDAVIAAGALAAWSDGRVHPVERLEMLVYMRRSGLSPLRRRDVLEIFDQRVRALRHDPPSATRATLDLLADFSGSGLAWTVLRAAEHVAAADSRIQEAKCWRSAPSGRRSAYLPTELQSCCRCNQTVPGTGSG